MNRIWNILVGMMLVVTACALVHGQVAGFSFVNWDDDLHVATNRAVTDPGSVAARDHLMTPYLGYPVPVTVFSYILDHQVAGLNPSHYHVTNLLLHLLVCVTLFLAAMRLGCGTWLAAGVTLLFAIHPAVTEPVAWISGRKDLLAALFSLLSLSAFMAIPVRDRRIRARLPAFILGLLASLSKPSALLVPVLILALDLARSPEIPDRSREHPRPFRRWPAPATWLVLLAINAGLAVVAWRMEKGMGALDGASVSGGNWLIRLMAGAGWHARILAWPIDLSPKYLDPVGGPATWILVVGGVVIVALLTLTVFAFVRRSPAFVGLALALLAYAPQSGLMPLSRQYANSYVYLSLAGLVLALGAALAPYVARLRFPFKNLVAALILVGLGALGYSAHHQEQVYRDGIHLWQRVMVDYPDSPQVCRNMGNAWIYRDMNEPARAAAVYEKCIAQLGDRQFFLKNLAIAHFSAGNRELATTLLREMQTLNPDDPIARKYLNLLSE